MRGDEQAPIRLNSSRVAGLAARVTAGIALGTAVEVEPLTSKQGFIERRIADAFPACWGDNKVPASTSNVGASGVLEGLDGIKQVSTNEWGDCRGSHECTVVDLLTVTE